MQTIGITGSFGSGKTTVARMLGRKGCKVIDADRIAHRVIKKNTPQYRKILGEFGRSILKANGEIDRRQLAKLAFSRRESLNRLNRIIHPAVIKEIWREVAAARRSRRWAIVDAPLLVESGLHRQMDALIVVCASRKNQMQRVKDHSGLRPEMIRKIIGSQLPLRQKRKLADFIIDNNGSLRSTKLQVEEIWSVLSRQLSASSISCLPVADEKSPRSYRD